MLYRHPGSSEALGVGLDDLGRSLPTPAILGFRDSEATQNAPVTHPAGSGPGEVTACADPLIATSLEPQNCYFYKNESQVQSANVTTFSSLVCKVRGGK